MVDRVRRSFSEILQELTWLEDSTKKVAQGKVRRPCQCTAFHLTSHCCQKRSVGNNNNRNNNK